IFPIVMLLASLVPVTSSPWAKEGDPGGPLPGAKGTGGVDLGTIIVQIDAEQTAKVVSQLDKVALIVSNGTGIEAIDSLASGYNVQSMSPVFEAMYRLADGQPAVDDERASFYLLQLAEPVGNKEDLLGVVAEFRKVCKSAQLNYVYEPDRVPNDPLYHSQWSHQNTMAEGGWDFLGDEKI